jgi:O-methyltransferase
VTIDRAPAPAEAACEEFRELYLNLMKGCLTRQLFIDEEFRAIRWTDGWRRVVYAPIMRALDKRDLHLGIVGGNRTARETGRDWPPHGETMAGMARLDNVQACVTDVLRTGVPGDLIETGVWRGGTTVFMRAILAAFGDTDRRVWVADSFQGLPEPDATRYPADAGLHLAGPAMAASRAEVEANFAKYGLLDAQVQFLVGWFEDTLANAPIDQLAVVRLDGDLYQSTMEGLTALYPKLSVGGYLIVDDYGCFEPCRRAVTDYRAREGITEKIETIDWTGAFWKRLE